MRIIGDTNFPFLSYRKIALTLSLLVILAGVGYEWLGSGLNFGIDFAGGTQVTLKFRDEVDLEQLRTAVAGLEVGEPVIQRFDEPEKHEILIRVRTPEGEEGDFTGAILDLLHRDFGGGGSGFDLNTGGAKELTDELVAADPDGIGGDVELRESHYQPQSNAVFEYRKQVGIFSSLDDLDSIAELSPAVREFIRGRSVTGNFSLLGAENVGPSVGKELRKQAVLAIAFSLVGMLAYIWLRFQLPYGIGAVVALFHDVLITLSAVAITGREINLPTIAAFLTLVGYSVNDTVVVFDRVRENLRMHRAEALEGLMNSAINQTLSRTIITSGTTLMVVLTLFIFGGDVINTFAFVLLVGILVGTYSSIFVASPVALFVNGLLAGRRDRKRRKGRR